MELNLATILKLAIAVTALVGLGSKELASGQGVPQRLNRRFEYQLSFKGPHLVQLDGSIPFWDHYGDAIASDESVRITPSMKSKKGSVWSKLANPHENWEVEVVFRVNGRGRIGADGLALWYTVDRGLDGPVFGSADQWQGLGIFFDSYDNDVQSNNPYIMIILNDGTKIYNHNEDGANQISGGCMRDFRNKPYPTRAKIKYYYKTLTIYYHNGVTSKRDDYEICTRVNNVELPKNGYFGVSAATGGLADDHDVLAFLTHSLTTATAEGTDDQSRDVSDEERQRYDQEFNEYRDKLDKAKEEYKKEHPSKPGEYVGDEEKMYEAPEMREMKMILDGQNEIYLLVKTIAAKLDEVVGQQERELSLLTIINQRPSHNQQGSTSQQNPIEQQDVAGLLSSQEEVVSHIRDVRSVLNDVQLRVSSLGQGGVGSDGGSEVLRHLGELQRYMNTVHGDVKSLISSKETGEGGSCPATNCITPFLLFIFLLGQLACILAFLICRSRREAAAKKFY